MRPLFFLNKMALSAMLIFALLITSCSKNERAIEETSYTTLELKAITVDPLLLQFTVDETALDHLLATPSASTSLPVKYMNPTHRFRVVDQYSNTLLADTTVDYKAGEKNTITFFQPVAGGMLVLIGPPVNEPPPAAEKKKISIVYSLPEVPERVKVVVDNSVSGNSGADYAPSDSFSLKRGEFSPYFWSWNNRKPKLRIYDANNSLILQVNNSQFAEAIADFSIFSFSGISAGSVSLTKLY
ncbi:hypothetical protein [Longitalea arenae]|uniref:hypothetical protein n=1 Tax=Longitalea arenae TaxID=2812558 RepID=UPI001967B68C|nr:hypothetical protein [Longitalea arenae]